MEPVREGTFAKLGVLITAIGVAVTWYYAPGRTGVTVQPSPSPAPIVTTEPSPVPPTDPQPGPTTQSGEQVDPPPPQPVRPALPLDFTLRDGEQRTFLEDQASVAAEFNQIGTEDFVTLRVGTTGGESTPHAILNAGARFPIRVAGADYSVSVLSVDKSARTVGVRISRNSESQERGQ